MKRIYLLLIMLFILIVCNTISLLHANETVYPIQVQSIRPSASVPFAIEVIGTTQKGIHKFIIRDAIPNYNNNTITKEHLDTICNQLLQQIQHNQIQLVWADQIYAIIKENEYYKDAVRFKYLFVSQIEAMIPKTTPHNNTALARAYDIPTPYSIENPILPVPSIPEYDSISLPQQENISPYLATIQNNPVQFNHNSASESVQTFLTNQKNNDNLLDVLMVSTAMENTTALAIKNAITPTQTLTSKQILPNNNQNSTPPYLSPSINNDPTYNPKHTPLAQMNMQQTSNTLPSSKQKNSIDTSHNSIDTSLKQKEIRYQKYKEIEQLLESARNGIVIP